jgi:hypothetical protein
MSVATYCVHCGQPSPCSCDDVKPARSVFDVLEPGTAESVVYEMTPRDLMARLDVQLAPVTAQRLEREADARAACASLRARWARERRGALES